MARGRKPTPGPKTPRHERALNARRERTEAIRQKPDTYHDLAKKIDSLIRLSGLSETKVAERCNLLIDLGQAPDFAKRLYQSRISKWRHRQGEPDIVQISQLADALGAPRGYMLDPSRVEPPNPIEFKFERRVEELLAELGPEEVYRRVIGAAPVVPATATTIPDTTAEAGSSGDRHEKRRHG